MMKKSLKHAAAIVLLVGFAVFALGSMGSSPRSGGSSSSSKYTCSRNFECYVEGYNYIRCGRSSCNANIVSVGSGLAADCNCAYNQFPSIKSLLCGQAGSITMRKYKWLIAGIAVLFLITAVVFNVSAKSRNRMGSNCVEDGSCCPDKNTCTCE